MSKHVHAKSGQASMFARIKRLTLSLKRDTSGNTMLLFAMGLPVFVGATGFGTDFAQWYLWKRDIQYAVDQAAIAGAWARTTETTKSLYASRAVAEYNANVGIVADFDTAPTVTLSNYAGGTANSVSVVATATKTLPFSSMLTGQGTTIRASAQASFEAGKSFTSCLIAVDDDADGAITLGGNSILTAGCGIAALSTSDQAIVVDGNPTIDAGWVLARGGIDDWLSTHTDDEIHEYLQGLYDPFATLTPPDTVQSRTPRTYTCVKGTKTTRSNVTTDVNSTYTYYKGFSPDTNADGIITNTELAAATWQLQTNAKGKSRETSTTNQGFIVVSNDTVDGVVTTTTRTIVKTNNSSGANATWEMKTTVTTNTYSGTTSTTTPDQASQYPGTYSDINVKCQTTFAPGIYVIDGGGLDIDGQYAVTGAGVMFVLKNGAYVKINGGSNISLTAMTVSELVAAGVSTENANKLAGMLIFEARDSSGTNKNIINGNASTTLNGTIYMPISGLTFSGTAKVSSQCLMIAANTITLTGDANMSTFCPAGMTEDTVVANEASKVKLVA